MPFVFLAVKATVNCPPAALLYVCDGFCCVEVLPSPKFHSYAFALPVNVPVKFTVVGEGPLVGVPVKLAWPTNVLFPTFRITWFRSSILSVTFDVAVNPSYATFAVKLPSAGVPRLIVLPITLEIFAASVQLRTPLPFVVNICPVVPPVIVTPLLAPRFTLLPLRFRLPSALIALPDIDKFAILALPGTVRG